VTSFFQRHLQTNMTNDLWLGKQLGPYKILSLIGKGGTGRVYKARHVILEREAAIKILRADLDTDDKYHERFLKEARTIAKMRHPHIVQLYDFGLSQETYYMVMEYIAGQGLDAKLKATHASGRLLPGVAVWRIIKQMSEALSYTHERGVIHRDVKPANVLLSQDGNVVVSDFGVAKLLAGHGNTSTGTVTGTPAYMAPEQALGEAIDHRADLYSMAVIVYEMLAGRVPFVAPTLVTMIYKHLHEPVPPLRQFNPNVPPHVEAELLKALSKRPGERHQSVAEFQRALSRAGSARGQPATVSVEQVKTVIGPDGKEYVHIPAGKVWLGSPHSKDAPRREVYLDGFYISRYPVTNAEYHTFVEETQYLPPQHWHEGAYPSWKADEPIVYVNWHDAAAYCRWAEGRLPTAAEWEKAARGTDERRYPWGNSFDANRCNSKESGKDAVTPVGKYSPAGDSPYGVSDMAGNVWEWALDWYAPGQSAPSPVRNPMGPGTGTAKMIRGGSYNNKQSLVTCYTQDHSAPNTCAVNHGFRVRLSEELFPSNSSAPPGAPANIQPLPKSR
jgi:serine/threonine-protein kinase